ncbi:tRNA-uridine aminocarboxypropyltransferase [Comamonas sp. GB3 AK4-5]|uniref:tRNA-uridine aminocarboxypropyltransferase n=1 Tax=Comamonas sp. GB3 AK4-5 TaxID=3231487 RepID=UPI00351DE461
MPFSTASSDIPTVPGIATPAALQPHAVSRLRSARLARSTRPFLARGGPKGERCEGCRLRPSHCMCALRPHLPTQAGFCLLMHDAEPLKPSNTGWLIADVVQTTHAFGWSRTEVDPGLLALLADPQWQPYVVFPSEYVQPPERAVHSVQPPSRVDGAMDLRSNGQPTYVPEAQKPLFILLDATWSEARKMFRKSPYLDRFPVLGLQPEQISHYRLRRSQRDDHFCTSEVAALCLELSGHPQDLRAGQALEAYLEVYTHHYLQAKQQQPADRNSPAHTRLQHAVAAAFNAKK